jgi:hypothetical protein
VGLGGAARPGPGHAADLDFTSLATINGQGGLLAAAVQHAAEPRRLRFGAGKFGAGIQPLGTNQGNFVQYPMDGLGRGDEFTFAFWAMHPTLAWDAIPSARLLTLGGWMFTIPVGVSAGALANTVVLLPNTPAGTPGKASLNYTQSIASQGLAAATWHHVAMTLLAGTLRFYINGVLITTRSGLVMPDHLSDPNSIGSGLTLGGTTSGASGMWYSDLVVYRGARVPGQSTPRRSLTGHVTFDTTARTAIQPNVFGALHPPWYTGMDAAVVSPAVKMIRTDKLINATPMKAGGTDATHPTLGQSGLYSYDWQVVDRTLNEIVRLGAKPYISVDSTPQILGAGQPPLSGPT